MFWDLGQKGLCKETKRLSCLIISTYLMSLAWHLFFFQTYFNGRFVILLSTSPHRYGFKFLSLTIQFIFETGHSNSITLYHLISLNFKGMIYFDFSFPRNNFSLELKNKTISPGMNFLSMRWWSWYFLIFFFI